MPSPITLIMRQFLAWVAERPRRREEVREAWRSCPRISVWEDAVMEELVAYDGDGLIRLTARGRDAVSDVRDQMSEVGRLPLHQPHAERGDRKARDQRPADRLAKAHIGHHG